MIPWELGESRGGIGIRLRKGTVAVREIRLTITRKYGMEVNRVSITFLLAFEWSGKLKKIWLLRSWKCGRRLKSRINERTLERWEQGRAKPNPLAAALVLRVRRYPDMLERLEKVAAG